MYKGKNNENICGYVVMWKYVMIIILTLLYILLITNRFGWGFLRKKKS